MNKMESDSVGSCQLSFWKACGFASVLKAKNYKLPEIPELKRKIKYE